jgi:hypothetical protein
VKEWEMDGLERVSGGRTGVELGVNRYIRDIKTYQVRHCHPNNRSSHHLRE